MSTKPFKPLTIKKPNTVEEVKESTPPSAKRRKLSPPDDPPQRALKPPTSKAGVYARQTAGPGQKGERQILEVIRNPPSPVLHSRAIDDGGAGECHYSALWRLPSNKKNKTWTDDGVLAVVDGYATLYNNRGKNIGRTAVSSPLLPGSNLSVGGKEVEVDSRISRHEFNKIVKSNAASSEQSITLSSSPSSRTQAPFVAQKPMSMQAQMKAQIQESKSKPQNKVPIQSQLHVSAFKQPLKGTTVLPQGQGDKPVPRHDPKADGAIMFQRPKCPPGRQIVDVVLDPAIGKLLRPHQKEGVQFLYECVMGIRNFGGQGCILADDMGLGKTLTTIALLWTLLRQNPVHRDPPVVRKALIVCPVSLIRNWKREFRKWLGADRLGVLEFEDPSTHLRDFDGRVFQVMIIGYERLRMVADDLAKGHPIDIVICDEGHRLKTMKNKSAQAIESLNTPRRIILSGTPIQNDLSEFFSMVNFVNDGILGSQKGFVKDFETPIVRSRQPNATEHDIERGQDASDELSRTTRAFILRRTADILSDFLPPKTEYVLFCKPAPEQARIYLEVLASPMFTSALRSSEAAFQLITILKKLCNSPALMDPSYGRDDDTPSASLTALNEMLPSGLSRLYRNTMSSKIRLLDELLQQIRNTTDEKVVVISNYTSTLNLIERLLTNSNLGYLRLDGSVAAKKRQGLVDQFNRARPSQTFAFLLSARAGGVGLNLVGASRLVLFDVDWNPATDDQAVARIHRQGQTRHCRIYRFLIKGGLEERIWQRQVVKRALADSILQSGSAANSGATEGSKRTGSGPTSFSQEELKDLFRLDQTDGLRTHRLIGCRCTGSGLEPAPSVEAPPAGTKDSNAVQRQIITIESDEEVPDLKELMTRASTKGGTAMKKKMPSKAEFTTALAVHTSPSKVTKANTEMEIEKQELMNYTHLNTSIISGAVEGDEAMERIIAAVDDPCLDHVLRLGSELVGGGGVSFIFKKTTGR